MINLENTGNHITRSLDEAGFEMLYKSHFKGLFFFAMKYVKNEEAAREIVQETFAGLWEKRGQIDMDRSVKSYLATVIHNKCTNYLRDNRKFDRNILDIEGLLDVPNDEHTDVLMQSELSARIDEAINELPEKCREIFLLSRYENLRYQEIADKLQISVKTVETQVSKALQHMRSRLADYIALVTAFLLGIFLR